MKIKPEYYDEFRCTADKCPTTCCMQWKIAVDDKTYKEWENVKFYENSLASYVKDLDGSNVIALNAHNKCPFLNESGLCNLVLEHGDEILSNTCEVFPRQIHEFDDRVEYSLVSCCPEVVEKLKNSEKIMFNHDLMDKNCDGLYNLRGCMMIIMENQKYSVQDSLIMAYYVLQDVYDRENVSYKQLKEYLEADTLEELHSGIDELELCWWDTFGECNELWLDMVENYRKEGLYAEYIEDISLLAEDILEEYDEEILYEQWQLFLKSFSEYESLLRNYIVSEFFTNMLIPDSDMESMVVMMQWIAMEYVMIRQGLFLKWLKEYESNEEQMLMYESVRDYIVIVSRMTGYDQEDIYEYMNNSFQNLIWKWGYMWLIVGKA